MMTLSVLLISMDGRKIGKLDNRTEWEGRTDGRTDGRTNRRTDGQIKGQTDGRTDASTRWQRDRGTGIGETPPFFERVSIFPPLTTFLI